MIEKAKGAFDSTMTLAYKGAKKLFWLIVLVAVIVSLLTIAVTAGIYAAFN